MSKPKRIAAALLLATALVGSTGTASVVGPVAGGPRICC